MTIVYGANLSPRVLYRPARREELARRSEGCTVEVERLTEPLRRTPRALKASLRVDEAADEAGTGESIDPGAFPRKPRTRLMAFPVQPLNSSADRMRLIGRAQPLVDPELIERVTWLLRSLHRRQSGSRTMKWVTRERPKIDRRAGPWLIRRFIDADAEVFYVRATWCRSLTGECHGWNPISFVARWIPDEFCRRRGSFRMRSAGWSLALVSLLPALTAHGFPPYRSTDAATAPPEIGRAHV